MGSHIKLNVNGTKGEVPFNKIAIGEVFKFGDIFYLRTDLRYDVVGSVIDLENGTARSFSNSVAAVIPVESAVLNIIVKG